jgi:hypothetical protein
VVWGLQGNKPLMCISYSAVIVGEGAIFRDCRGMGKMWVLCKVVIID